MCALVGAQYSYGTMARNRDWATEASTLQATLRRYPLNAMSVYGVGWLHASNDQFLHAEAHYWRASLAMHS